jgi:DNA-binding Lrp family transcriptional regulator
MSEAAFVLIKFKKSIENASKNHSKFVELDLKKIEGVESVYLVDGDDAPYDAIAKVKTDSTNTLYKIILGGISKFPSVLETTTMVIIEA